MPDACTILSVPFVMVPTARANPSRGGDATSTGLPSKGGGRATERRSPMGLAYSSCARSETVGFEKKFLGGLLLAVVVCALLASVVAVLTFPARSAQGAPTLRPGCARSQVAGGLASPTAMEFAPDGRLFVAEQRGTLRVVKSGANLATFLDISGRVDSAGERGLLGLAFDPAFSNNHYVYLYYTQRATG